MRRARTPRLLAAIAAVFAAATDARAAAGIDSAAAFLVYPLVQLGSAGRPETVIEISNESDAAVSVRCFYAGGPGACATGSACATPDECADGRGSCVPSATNAPFELRLTPRQPLSWSASQGRTTFPCPGAGDKCPGTDSNTGSNVPALSAPYVGALYCTVVDPVTRKPRPDNVLQGSALIEERDVDSSYMDVARYSAVGIPAIADGANGNSALSLDGGEMDTCPTRLTFHHPAEDYVDISGVDTQTAMLLAVVPCTWDGVHALPPRATLQMSVYNEFEQRFNTSLGFVHGPQLRRLYSIDSAPQPARSIFSAGVASTASLHTHILALGEQSGVLAVMIEVRRPLAEPSKPFREALQASHGGARPFDVVFLDPPECPGDCLGDQRFDAADLGRVVGHFNSGCICGQGAGVADAQCGPGDFPYNQCYAADLDGNRCLAPGELTQILSAAPAYGADGCPP